MSAAGSMGFDPQSLYMLGSDRRGYMFRILFKKEKKFKEKEKSAWEPMKKLSIRWIFSFFVKGDDDLSFSMGTYCPIINLNYHYYE